MALDPAQGDHADKDRRNADRLADLERRIRSLETSSPAVQAGAGAPVANAANLRTGTPYIDTTNNRLYYVVNGAWRFVALT